MGQGETEIKMQDYSQLMEDLRNRNDALHEQELAEKEKERSGYYDTKFEEMRDYYASTANQDLNN